MNRPSDSRLFRCRPARWAGNPANGRAYSGQPGVQSRNQRTLASRSDTDAFAAGSRGWNAPSLITKAARAAPNPSGDVFSGNAQVDPRLCLHCARIDRAARAGAVAPKAAARARAAAVASVSRVCNAGARDASARRRVFVRNVPIRNSSVVAELPFPKTYEWFREPTLILLP